MQKPSNFLKVFISCHLILLQVSVALSQGQTRVVGGVPTTIENAPFLVQIIKKGYFTCGGTLVNERFVVSAAHCFDEVDPSRYSVVGGVSMLTDNGIRAKISKIIIPNTYDRNSQHMDLAVVKLSSPLKGQSIKPTDLCRNNFKHGDPVQIFGWGFSHENAQGGELQLKTANVSVMNEYVCADMYRYRAGITDSMLCAAAPGKGSCFGDSGGPAIINGEFCGIVSWGVGCARYDSPGVYTNVLKVNQFIKNAMQQ